jgi:hypothetical protein
MPANPRQFRIKSIFMKLLALLVSPFYSVEVRTSEAQLRLDFGDFPPIPLRGGSLSGKFEIIRTRSLGGLYFEISIIRRLMQAIESDRQEISQELLQHIGHDSVLALRRALGDLPKYLKPVVLTLVFSYFSLYLVAKRAVSRRSRPKGIGAFTPAFNDQSNIIIRSGKLRGRADDGVVSHEHLHLLQHRNTELHSRHINCPEMLMSENFLAEPFAHYLLEKVEVEARLHEAVLSHYRSRRRLPTTIPGFLGLLAGSPQYGWLVIDVLEPQKVDFEHEIDQYPERETMFTKQLEHALLSFKTDEILGRFLTEVLTVMYGNLLKYYGDEDASHSFLNGIDRPNFYDDLYGLKTASSHL